MVKVCFDFVSFFCPSVQVWGRKPIGLMVDQVKDVNIKLPHTQFIMVNVCFVFVSFLS